MADGVKTGRKRNWRRALLRQLQQFEPEITEGLVRKARLGDPGAAQACLDLLNQLDKNQAADTASPPCNECPCRLAGASLNQS